MFESAVSGLITGSAGALIGLCLVLTYRMAGVINFAQASFGTFGAFTMLQLYDAGWAYLPAASSASRPARSSPCCSAS